MTPPMTDWQEARLFYLGMPRGQRSLKAVAAHANRTYERVRERAKKDHWAADARRLDAEAARQAEQKIVKTHAQRMTEFLQAVDSYLAKFTRDLASGQIRAHDPNALVGMLKLAMVHAGEATERIEVRELREVLVVWTQVALRHVPEDERQAFIADVRERIGELAPPADVTLN